MTPERLGRCPVCRTAHAVVADPTPEVGVQFRIVLHGESGKPRCPGSSEEVPFYETWLDGGTEEERVGEQLDAEQDLACGACGEKPRAIGDHFCARCRAAWRTARREDEEAASP